LSWERCRIVTVWCLKVPSIVAKIPSKPLKDFPEFNPAKPEDTDFQLRRPVADGSAGRRHRQQSLVPVGREVKPGDGLAKKAIAGEKKCEFERSRQVASIRLDQQWQVRLALGWR
jgi:hypothetical protein